MISMLWAPDSWIFASPLALLGLAALPVIWFILRATPPAPKERLLPSLSLLDAVENQARTPARTPWWILLLRLVAAACLCLGLARPVFAPAQRQDLSASGPVLIIIDNGWTSAQRWRDIQAAALASLDGETASTSAHLLLTAPRQLQQSPALRLDRLALEARIKSLRPLSWNTDRRDALERLQQAALSPARILYITDGLDPGTLTPFAQALARLAPLQIYAAPPRGVFAITSLQTDPEGVRLNLAQLADMRARTGFVSALTADGRSLATAPISAEKDSRTGQALFQLPPAALSQVVRFQITDQNAPGAVWLWDSAQRTRRVGLVSADTSAQPLLSDMHYIRKALAPFAEINEATPDQLIRDNPDAIILTDIGQIDPEISAPLSDWIEAGGVLIRFAGPRMATQSDQLLPVPLRRSSRAIGGGTLTWEQPQSLGPFPQTSPFFGLDIGPDIQVRQQVLAQPGPELTQRSWAQLRDGSPLITARMQGRGALILFHVTAGPDWSDLPYSGVFVDLLRRAIAAGQGHTVQDETGLYTPRFSLNGSGQLVQPQTAAIPLAATDFGTVRPSKRHPAGLYQGPAGMRALNVAENYQVQPVETWPETAELLGDAEARTLKLGGSLITTALMLILIDLLIAAALAGHLTLRRHSRHLLMIGLSSLLILPDLMPAHAQYNTRYGRNIQDDYGAYTKTEQAALGLRLAYIETGDRAVDRLMQAGLTGLSTQLYRRSSVEPAPPHAIRLEQDELHVYPILFIALPEAAPPFSAKAIARLNAYLRQGGSLFIDTRSGDDFSSGNQFDQLRQVFAGLDTPPLSPVPQNHVLTRSFYLLKGFPGRYANRTLWIESTAAGNKQDRRGDGVSRIFVGDADYLSAWAIDEKGQPLYSVDGGDRQREMALRAGINLVIYVLTGNYKEDQVHLPALLERLDDTRGIGEIETPEGTGEDTDTP